MSAVITVFRFAPDEYSALEWQSALDDGFEQIGRLAGWSKADGAKYRVSTISEPLRRHLETGFDLQLSIACTITAEDGLEEELQTVVKICEAAGDQWIAIDDRNVVLAARRFDELVVSDFGDDLSSSRWLEQALEFFPSPKPVQQSALKEMLQ